VPQDDQRHHKPQRESSQKDDFGKPHGMMRERMQRIPPKSCMTGRFQLLLQFRGSLEAMNGGPQQLETAGPTIPIGLRLVAVFLRLVFLGALVAIAVRLSGPQSETIWTVYETPGD
jgi:hypothetical protein